MEICLFSGSLSIAPRICYLFAFLRLPIPYLVRYFEHNSAIYNFNWDSWLYSVLESFLGTFIVALNFLFVLSGLVDFQRRKTMIQACGTMIDPQKANYDEKYRLFPTINMIDPQSL